MKDYYEFEGLILRKKERTAGGYMFEVSVNCELKGEVKTQPLEFWSEKEINNFAKAWNGYGYETVEDAAKSIQ